MIVIDPRGLSPREWCDYTGSSLPRGIAPMVLQDGSQWREWGMHIIMALRSRGVTIPYPDQFAEFEDWADEFNQAVSSLEI